MQTNYFFILTIQLLHNMEPVNFAFDYSAAVKNKSLTNNGFHVLGKIYEEDLKIYINPIILTGPYGLQPLLLKIRNTATQLKAQKTYHMKYRVVFIRAYSIEIDVIFAEELPKN